MRLQAKRYGAGMAVSEMVSSFAIHHGNEKTHQELLRVHPQEATAGPGGVAGPTALQLFGQDPEVMRSAAAFVAEHVPGVDVIDLNMGCPVPKVCKTGAGAALIKDPDTAVAVARAAREGSGLPVTVKLRSGQKPGDTDGFELAHRLVDEAGVAAIGFHPRSAAVHHKGVPDYDLAPRLVAVARRARDPHGRAARRRRRCTRAYEHTGAEAVMLARGSLGNPWLFEQLLGLRDADDAPARDEVARRAGLGRSTAASSTWARCAPAGTCASATPGTSSASRWSRPSPSGCRRRCSRRTMSPGRAPCWPRCARSQLPPDTADAARYTAPSLTTRPAVQPASHGGFFVAGTPSDDRDTNHAEGRHPHP